MRPHLCRPFAVYLVIKVTGPRREGDAVCKIAAGTYWSTDYQVALCAAATADNVVVGGGSGALSVTNYFLFSNG